MRVALACLLSLSIGCGSSATGGTGGGDGGSITGVGGDGANGSGADGGAATNGSGGDGGSGASESTGGQGGESACAPRPRCDVSLPNPGQARDWVHVSSSVIALQAPLHRGHDMFYGPNDEVWVMAKFAYGLIDKDLKDEDIDIYLDEGCAGTWTLLDTVRTTDSGGHHPTVEGVEDTGGWVYYKLPSNITLAKGRHHFHLVVGGDLTSTDVTIDIVDPGAPLIVTDVDGTLTTSENEEFTALVSGALPDANPSAREVLSTLADKGYRIYYMSARPEFLVARTHDFVEARGFPPGLVRTTLNTTGALGSAAVGYKSGELAAIAARGLVPTYVFGNTESDAEAYDNAMISPVDHRVFFQFSDDVFGGRRIEDYAELLAELSALPQICP